MFPQAAEIDTVLEIYLNKMIYGILKSEFRENYMHRLLGQYSAQL